MKKLISLALVFVLVLSMALPVSAARTEKTDITYRSIRIVIDGQEIAPCDERGNGVEPFIMDATGTTYLPLRAVAGALGLSVEWDAATSTVKLTSGSTPVSGSDRPIYSNSKQSVDITYKDIKVELDGRPLELVNAAGDTVEPFILNSNNSTYLPLRVIGEALGREVSWEATTSTASLSSPVTGEGYWLPTRVIQNYVEYVANEPAVSSNIKEEYRYDGLGRITGIYYEDLDSGTWYSETQTYHDDGSFKDYTYTDSLGYSEKQSFNALGLETYYEELSPDGQGLVCAAEYDSAGNILSYAEANHEGNGYGEAWLYDGEGRVSEYGYICLLNFEEDEITAIHTTYEYAGDLCYETQHYPDGREYVITTTYTFDSKGNIISEVIVPEDGISTQENRYDSRGNLIYCRFEGSYGDWNMDEYTYDELDRELSYTGSNSWGEHYERSSRYDSRGRLVYYFEDNNGYTTQDDYSYDPNGNLIKHVHSENGAVWEVNEYFYDEAGRYLGERSGSSASVINVEYNAKGHPVKMTATDANDHTNVTDFVCDSYGNITSLESLETVVDVYGDTYKVFWLKQSYEYKFFPLT